MTSQGDFRRSVYTARHGAHDALLGTDARRLQIVGNSPHAEECHLRLNRVPKGPELVMKGRRTGGSQRTESDEGQWQDVGLLGC